jgi:hypothetical protein
MKSFILPILVGLVMVSLSADRLSAQTRIVRIVTYNIEADINGATAPLPGLIAPPGNAAGYQSGGVLAGIGEELLNGNAQPVDLLALQETTSNPQTVSPIVNGLNEFYGVAGMYSNSSYRRPRAAASPPMATARTPSYSTRAPCNCWPPCPWIRLGAPATSALVAANIAKWCVTNLPRPVCP